MTELPVSRGDFRVHSHFLFPSFLRLMEIPRLTSTPVFRSYWWRSKAFLDDTWRFSTISGAEKFIAKLASIDIACYPHDVFNVDVATFRAHLGLPNICNVSIHPTTGNTTRIAGCFAITLVRFQVLDLLYSIVKGGEVDESDQTVPTQESLKSLATGPRQLLSRMALWLDYLKSFQTGDIERPSATDAMKNIPVPDTSPATLLPMAAFTDMMQSALAIKTLKNFQAMGTALVWIMESFDWLPDDVRDVFSKVKIGSLLRPLTYTLNSSLVLAICDHDLTGQHGHVSAWYQVRALLGSYRTPRLVHLENVITTVIRQVAIGMPAKDVACQHWYPGLLAMPPPHEEDPAVFAHFASDTENPHPPRQRRKASRPALLPPLLAASQPTTPSTSIRYSLAVGVCESTPTPEELDARLKAKQQADEAEQAQLELERARLEQERITKEKQEEEIRAKEAAEKCALKLAQEERRAAQAARLKEEADNRTRREDARKERLDKELALKKAQEEKARAARSKQDADRRSQRDDAVRKPKQKRTVAKASTDVCGKRKGRSESRGRLGSTKKRKVQQQTEEEEEVSGPLLEVELNPPEKSKRPLYLTGICPDGVRTVKFPWVGHVDTDRIERPMMENLLLSIDQGRPKCFRRHVDGVIPTDPPKDEESDITSPVDIDQILGTGCDVFVEDLLIPGKSLSPGVALRVRHNLDVEMEVQVPGLRFLPQDAEVEKKYPNSLRKTTLRTFLRHANSKDGITLNCLKLPYGLDLEDIAFRQTNGLGGPRGPFAEPEHVPREVQYWEIAGTPNALTKGHWDKAPTRVTVEGPGAKLWIKRRTKFYREAKWFRHEVEDSQLLENWDPDEPDISTRQYEGVILLPRSGTLFMQSKEHIVVGIAPISSSTPTDPSDDSDKFTLVTGGHFLSASTTIPSACMLLHLALLNNAATNVEHDVMWRTFVRICAFWMDVSMDRPSDIPFNEAYLPRFSDDDVTGWMDIVSIASLVVLSTPLDGRHYLDSLPLVEASQRAFVRDQYRKWREWFAEQFKGYKDDAQIDWEQDVFTAVLIHLAVVLVHYHERERYQDGTGPDVLLGQSNETLTEELQDALDLYQEGLGETLVSELNKGKPESCFSLSLPANTVFDFEMWEEEDEDDKWVYFYEEVFEDEE
ncbi:hypothetical protein K438DRAFT_1772730 [Mycena galopus ATCC 62051]|nr:hypothetical protein K438DRAFT_1772730 [Mycena galopus ATCC 62051]